MNITSTIDEAARSYLESLWARHYADNTLKVREQQLRRFTMWMREHHRVERVADVRREHIEQFRREMRGRGVSAGSQQTYLNTLHQLFVFLVDEHVIASDPTSEISAPQPPRALPRDVLSHNDVERVLACIDARGPLGLRDRALFELLYSSGLRRAEVLALELDDVDLDALQLRVRGGKGGKDRVVPLGARAARWVRAWLADARPLLARAACSLLFVSARGDSLCERQLTRIGHEHIERALGRERGACHVFRHSAATALLGVGADVRHVQELLGHEDIRTTQIYTRVAVRDLQASHARFHPARDDDDVVVPRTSVEVCRAGARVRGLTLTAGAVERAGQGAGPALVGGSVSGNASAVVCLSERLRKEAETDR